jgi:hypothetical protein
MRKLDCSSIPVARELAADETLVPRGYVAMPRRRLKS